MLEHNMLHYELYNVIFCYHKICVILFLFYWISM